MQNFIPLPTDVKRVFISLFMLILLYARRLFFMFEVINVGVASLSEVQFSASNASTVRYSEMLFGKELRSESR